MAERFTDSKGETGRRGFSGSFGSNAEAAHGAPPPLLSATKFSERMAELEEHQRAADREPGAPRGAVASYIVVDDGEGGQKLQRVEPFGGDRASVQGSGYVAEKPPVTDPNPSLGRSQAGKPFHRGRTPFT